MVSKKIICLFTYYLYPVLHLLGYLRKQQSGLVKSGVLRGTILPAFG